MAFVFVFLTSRFYSDYSKCSEIEQKIDRPYIRIILNYNGVDFAIPLRSNIKHPHAFLTDRVRKCGLDFSKAVAIIDPSMYIDTSRQPVIRQSEFNFLRGKEFIVEQRFKKYVSDYKKALTQPNLPRNALLLRYSTLQYFQNYL